MLDIGLTISMHMYENSYQKQNQFVGMKINNGEILIWFGAVWSICH